MCTWYVGQSSAGDHGLKTSGRERRLHRCRRTCTRARTKHLNLTRCTRIFIIYYLTPDAHLTPKPYTTENLGELITAASLPPSSWLQASARGSATGCQKMQQTSTSPLGTRCTGSSRRTRCTIPTCRAGTSPRCLPPRCWRMCLAGTSCSRRCRHCQRCPGTCPVCFKNFRTGYNKHDHNHHKTHLRTPVAKKFRT